MNITDLNNFNNESTIFGILLAISLYILLYIFFWDFIDLRDTWKPWKLISNIALYSLAIIILSAIIIGITLAIIGMWNFWTAIGWTVLTVIIIDFFFISFKIYERRTEYNRGTGLDGDPKIFDRCCI